MSANNPIPGGYFLYQGCFDLSRPGYILCTLLTKQQVVGDIEASSLRPCIKCGALVAPMEMDIHASWHEKLRRAVDETGILD